MKLERDRDIGLRVPPERARRIIQAVLDVAIAMSSVVAALWVRYEAHFPSSALDALMWVMVFAGAVQLAAGWSQGLYVGRWRFGGFEEMWALARATAITTVALLALNLPLSPRPIPLSACVASGLFTLLAAASLRWSWRSFLQRRLRPAGEDLTRVVIVGAGEAGEQLVASMMRNPEGRYLPVAFLDDDPAKSSLRMHGVPVMGGTGQAGELAERLAARTVILALPGADGAVIRELSTAVLGCGLEVLVLPPVDELLGAGVRETDVRPLTDADLLGRRRIDSDVGSIAGYVTNRRVLVTGAGGSIGSELCRQLFRFAPAELVMLDRDESALHAVQLSIEGRAMLDDRNLVVADIRDLERIAEVFDEHRPDVVFHAAALKHLPLLEMHPREGIKTNCQGTQNLLGQAQRSGVVRFVNVSTDKAADPTSVLGSTKRIAERLTAEVARTCGLPYVNVRFGNVLGSRGSVLTAFRAQIDTGGPLTVTHPDVTRYFMTVEEAVELVIQAGALGERGEALVLDMGRPVRIADVARALIDQSERDIEITYTGLRPGEKLHEVLTGVGEVGVASSHPLINKVEVEPLAPDTLDELAQTDTADLAAALRTVAVGVAAHGPDGRT